MKCEQCGKENVMLSTITKTLSGGKTSNSNICNECFDEIKLSPEEIAKLNKMQAELEEKE